MTIFNLCLKSILFTCLWGGVFNSLKASDDISPETQQLTQMAVEQAIRGLLRANQYADVASTHCSVGEDYNCSSLLAKEFQNNFTGLFNRTLQGMFDVEMISPEQTCRESLKQNLFFFRGA